MSDTVSVWVVVAWSAVAFAQMVFIAYLLRMLREVTLLAASRTTTEAANYRRVQKAPKKRVDDDLTELELLDPTTRGV